MEGSRRFRAVPPTPLRPWPWGASHLGCPGRPRGWGAPRGRKPPPGGNTKTHYGRFPVGRCGKVWKAWESKLDSPPPLLRPKGLLATYIMWGRGGGRCTTCPQGLCATLPPLNPVAPLLDPSLDAVLDRNPLGFSP